MDDQSNFKLTKYEQLNIKIRREIQHHKLFMSQNVKNSFLNYILKNLYSNLTFNPWILLFCNIHDFWSTFCARLRGSKLMY
jgi:hypothetical protein